LPNAFDRLTGKTPVASHG